MERRDLGISPQELDPLSWFTGRAVPIVFAGLIVLYGGFRIPTWFTTEMPWLQPIAVLLCASACVVVFVAARTMRRLSWSVGIANVALASAALVISAIGYAGTDLAVELWWAPFGLAVAFSSLAPYLSPPRVFVLGGAAILVAVPIAYLCLDEADRIWGPVSAMLIIASPVICGVVASVTFSFVVVHRMLPVIAQRSRMLLPLEPADPAAEAVERVRLARLTARAVPFLHDLAERGVVGPSDRALAGQLARRLRDDLVTQSNLSWLDSIAAETRLVVVDPERRASRMRPTQRTALRGLLRAVLDIPGADRGSVLIELRGRDDGATDVGLSLDADLPEGRRIMHIAPHILTLRTAVDELQWESRTMRFVVRDAEPRHPNGA